jgi:prepilin-type N-terminal cleavage/methylation domain-containing protein
MKLTPQIKAFTLVELLVVITIIATLAGIAFPVYNTVKERGSQTKALTHAKQLGLACKVYASDYDGAFPKYDWTEAGDATSSTDANKVLTNLTKGGYVPDETLFYVQGSAWSTVAHDNDKILDEGENHWGYFAGINDTDTPGWPLIVDGWKPGGNPGIYDPDPKQPGGVWKGKKAIVIRVDMSGKIENLNSSYTAMGNTTSNQKKNIMLEAAGEDGEAGWLTNTEALLPVAE